MPIFTRQYLYDEIVRLRRMWSNVYFWQDLEKASNAFYGLLYVYVNADSLEDKDILMMKAIQTEFDIRLSYEILRKY